MESNINCRVCNIPLIPLDNWYKSQVKKNSKICKSCMNKNAIASCHKMPYDEWQKSKEIQMKYNQTHCYTCDVELVPRVNFNIKRKRTRGYQCNSCMNTYGRNWRKNNPESIKLTTRRSKLKGKYGISLEQFNTLWELQHGLCNLCNKPLHRRNGGFAIDHDHLSGQVRAILCSRCNHVVGVLETKWARENIVRIFDYINMNELVVNV